MISGVYRITSLVKPDRCYIGSSMDIHKRWEYHLRNLRINKHHSQKLQRHYNKYGKNDLTFSILIGCDKEELISTEQYFIDVYKPYFNGRLTAASNGGFTQTEEAKRKISESRMGDKNPNFGRKFTEDHRKKLSDAMKGRVSSMKGKKHTEEAKKKLSEARKGKRVSIATEFKKGRIEDFETKEKRIAKIKGRIPWNKGVPMKEESKIRLSNSIAGKPRPGYKPHLNSEETKKKMSEARTKYYQNKRLEKLLLDINNN